MVNNEVHNDSPNVAGHDAQDLGKWKKKFEQAIQAAPGFAAQVKAAAPHGSFIESIAEETARQWLETKATAQDTAGKDLPIDWQAQVLEVAPDVETLRAGRKR